MSISIQRRALIIGLFLGSALTLRGTAAEHHAHLSDGLLAHEALQTTVRTHVIVHGDAATLDAIATRHHLQILRSLPNGAVFAANSAEIADLASDATIDHLSGDPTVKPWMTVSNQATAADLTRAGQPGGLLGLGGVPAVTGAGIGVAVVDSGITPHTALANKVVANVSFVTGDAPTGGACGPGTHVAGIIAGNAAAARNVTGLYDGGIAPGVQLVNVRVLGADGTGR